MAWLSQLGLIVIVCGVLAGTPALAQDYFVDFAGGSDAANGTSRQAPFKHCPGDAEATDRAGTTALKPGDRAIFKGGVHYRGTVAVPFSGAPGRPIVYDGNTAGSFGVGQAVIQGGEQVGGWQKVGGPEEVEGNPNWQQLWFTYVDARHTFFSFSLYQGATYLNCAQDPNPEIPFYHDRLDTYLPVEPGTAAITATTVTDAAYFTQPNAHYYDGAYVAVWVRPSVIVYQRILGYDPAGHTVTIEPIKNQLYGNRRARYSLLNSLRFLDRPGEYYLDEKGARDGKVRLVLWPPDAGLHDPVTMSVRKYGFALGAASHVVIDGFRILQQGGDRAAGIMKTSSEKTSHVVIRNNEISRVRTYPNRSAAIRMADVDHGLIERNNIHENAYCAGVMVNRFNDSVTQYNLLRKNGSTAVDYYDCHRSKLLRNVVRDNLGMHANGLTMYVGCTDILVEGNECYNANGCTTNDGDRIIIRNNIFDPAPSGGSSMGLWQSDPLNNLVVLNNVCLGQVYIGNRGTGWVFRNNVLGGFGGAIQPDAQLSHNVYTRLGPAQARRGLGEGEKVVEDVGLLFVDRDAKDYRPRPGGPLIDAGTDVGIGTDFVGTPVPQGRAPDVGAYEYVPDGPRRPADAVPES